MAIINAGLYMNGASPTPPIESEWVLYQTFTTTTAWTVPESNWYRIFCVGKSADGQDGGKTSGTPTGTDILFAGGGAGGNSGAIAVSTLKLEKGKVYNITITTSLTSFADLLSAEAGLISTTVPNWYSAGKSNPTIVRAYGGNIVNADGFIGGDGASGGRDVPNGGQPQMGGNNGGKVATTNRNNNVSCGGGGAQYSRVVPINKYSIPQEQIVLNGPLSGGVAYTNATDVRGKGFVNWSSPNVILSGGGGGGAGNIYPASGMGVGSGQGVAGQGQPGLVIIEKGK